MENRETPVIDLQNEETEVRSRRDIFLRNGGRW